MLGEVSVILRYFLSDTTYIRLKCFSNPVSIIGSSPDSFTKPRVFPNLLDQKVHFLPNVGLRDGRSHPLFGVALRFRKLFLQFFISCAIYSKRLLVGNFARTAQLEFLWGFGDAENKVSDVHFGLGVRQKDVQIGGALGCRQYEVFTATISDNPGSTFLAEYEILQRNL